MYVFTHTHTHSHTHIGPTMFIHITQQKEKAKEKSKQNKERRIKKKAVSQFKNLSEAIKLLKFDSGSGAGRGKTLLKRHYEALLNDAGIEIAGLKLPELKEAFWSRPALAAKYRVPGNPHTLNPHPHSLTPSPPPSPSGSDNDEDSKDSDYSPASPLPIRQRIRSRDSVSPAVAAAAAASRRTRSSNRRLPAKQPDYNVGDRVSVHWKGSRTVRGGWYDATIENVTKADGEWKYDIVYIFDQDEVTTHRTQLHYHSCQH